MTAGWIPAAGEFPLAPANPAAVTSYERGSIDIRWDDPSILTACSGGGNTVFSIVGVNVYRSDDSERGPYRRINPIPVSGNFYRDFTDNVLVSRETIRWDDGWIHRGDAPNAGDKWVFKTRHAIYKQGRSGVYANSPADVSLSIDGMLVPVQFVFGQTGQVRLIATNRFDPVTEKLVPPPLPGPDSEVALSYYTLRNFVQSGPSLDFKSFYRVTTVALDATTPSGFIETPLEFSFPFNLQEIEQVGYIWREAVRRNNWILEQGGERIKIFIKKTCGVPCFCTLDERQMAYSKQPRNDCAVCFGTAILGGYEGPYEGIVAPDDAERRVTQTEHGRSLQHTFDSWTGPHPMLTQRDFIVRQTNERYSIGAVHKPSNRGNVLQQHFSLHYLEDNDIRYRVPIDGVTTLPWPDECRITGQKFYHGEYYYPGRDVPYPIGPNVINPLHTEKSNIPDERELRGKTVTWSNQHYLWPVLLPLTYVCSEVFSNVWRFVGV